MKRNIIYIAMASVFMSGLASCKKYLDVNKSPNSAESVDPKLLFSAAVTSYVALRPSGDFYIPLALGGQSIADGGNNPTAWDSPSPNEYVFSINFFGNAWTGLYSNVGINLKQAITLSENATPKNNNAAAQCKVLWAQAYYDLTTLFGDVPFSESINSEVSYP
ncbi:MAG: SusD/RagB family nutrient-binding outer membrane lipoprotein [Bacteroidota bacterium]